jgi:hypothetical protein
MTIRKGDIVELDAHDQKRHEALATVIRDVGDCGYEKCTFGDQCVTLLTKSKNGKGTSTINRRVSELKEIE